LLVGVSGITLYFGVNLIQAGRTFADQPCQESYASGRSLESKEAAETTWHFETRIFQLFAEYAPFQTVSRFFYKKRPPFPAGRFLREMVAPASCESSGGIYVSFHFAASSTILISSSREAGNKKEVIP
jgi:hypothetical protein